MMAGRARLLKANLRTSAMFWAPWPFAHAREVLLEVTSSVPCACCRCPSGRELSGEPGGGENAGSNVISRVEPGAIL